MCDHSVPASLPCWCHPPHRAPWSTFLFPAIQPYRQYCLPSTNMQQIPARASHWKMHINLKTQGLSDVASQNKQACISSSSHPYFFFLLPLPPRVFKDGGKEEKKKGKFQCHQVACECALCGMARQPGKLLLLSVTPGLCSTWQCFSLEHT